MGCVCSSDLEPTWGLRDCMEYPLPQPFWDPVGVFRNTALWTFISTLGIFCDFFQWLFVTCTRYRSCANSRCQSKARPLLAPLVGSPNP